jgi:ssRNA-specific RNase YbeY (16S rRNA maturation enzyme)
MVQLASNTTVQRMNRIDRGVDRPTDVLSYVAQVRPALCQLSLVFIAEHSFSYLSFHTLTDAFESLFWYAFRS